MHFITKEIKIEQWIYVLVRIMVNIKKKNQAYIHDDVRYVRKENCDPSLFSSFCVKN